MHTLLSKIAHLIAAPLVGLLMLGGYNPTPYTQVIPPQSVIENTAPLGASNAIETSVALFETSLQSSITSSATSMTLVSALTKDGTNLASSTYSFILDEGTASQEFVRADCTATACTNMERGLSVITGTTTISSSQVSHRRGATVKITDAPVILVLNRIVNGIQALPNPIKYVSTIATTTIAADRSTLASVGLLLDTAFNSAGVINATEAASGVSQLATQLQQASSTATLSGRPLVLQAKYASSTYNSATAGLVSVVTKNNGKIDDFFIGTSTLFSTSSIQGTAISFIGKNSQSFSATGTFAVPANVTKIHVRMFGGGGAGGGAPTPASINAAGGGAGGGYCEGIIDVSATTSIYVMIGKGGPGGSTAGITGGTSFIGPSIASSTGGTGGAVGVNNQLAAGGTPGIGKNCDINGSGSPGAPGVIFGSTALGGNGGSTIFGAGGLSTGIGGSAPSGSGFGAGGAGGAGNSGASASGGSGADGFVIISW